MENTPAKTILEFKGKYRFLSNFYYSEITITGVPYLSVEAAFNAAKSLDMATRLGFSNLTPSKAKAKGRRIVLRANWEITRVEIMELCLRAKFTIPTMRASLLATGDMHLVEGNQWNDTFWGVCRGKGENMLGKLLMNVRHDLAQAQSEEWSSAPSS